MNTTSSANGHQELSPDMIRAVAAANNVCVRPIINRLVDTVTGREQLVPIDCGSTQERQCPPCAERNRRLRMQQCREGWHTDEETLPPLPDPDEVPDDDHDQEDGEDDQDDAGSRRVRSTRRRQDVPDLPRIPVEHRSIGKAFTGNDGKTYRPSMFNTVTLGSYGKVHPDDGTPVDPATYDYRRAALDAMHFAKLIDRLIQNMRRCAGFKLQYFGCVEAQKRLAPHLHLAIRGVIPRRVFQQVVAATYHQVWWPHVDEPVYTGTHLPVWDEAAECYVDPDDGIPLQTWQQALDAIDDDPASTPMHVLRFGPQTDYQGLLGGTRNSEYAIGYVCKYLTKDIAHTHDGDDGETSAGRKAHIDRIHAETRWLPCTERCANWLRFGIQPQDAEPGLIPGECDHKAHRRENAGFGGRRVPNSRHWTGKTLDEHRADRRAIVQQVLDDAGVDMDDHERCSATATTTTTDGKPRYLWLPLKPTETPLPAYREAVLSAIEQRRRWREQYETAKARAEQAPARRSAVAVAASPHRTGGEP